MNRPFKTKISADAGIVLPGILSAITLGTDGSGNIGSGPGVSRVRARKTTTQAIPTSAWTPIQFDSEQFDTDTMHDTVTNNSRFVCKTAGVYGAWAHVPLGGSAAGLQRIGCWMLNGVANTDYHGIANFPFGVSINSWVAATMPPLALAVNDYIEFCVFQDTGGNLATTPTAQTPAIASVVRMA